jgi:hypothetical protein
MELKIIRPTLKEFNFSRSPKANEMREKANEMSEKANATIDKKIAIKISIRSKIEDITLKEDNVALIKSSIIYEIENFGLFKFEIDCIVKSNDIKEIIKFWKLDKENLPKDIMERFDNSLYYFTMPLTLLISERAGIPPPLPPPFSQKQFSQKTKSSKKSVKTTKKE